jgi:hypothetical protein
MNYFAGLDVSVKNTRIAGLVAGGYYVDAPAGTRCQLRSS